MLLYNRTKLAQVLFVKELVKKINGGSSGSSPNKLFVNATHPGAVNTDQQEQAVEAYGTLGKAGVKATRPFMKDPVKAGCRSALFAATSEDIVTGEITGQYIVPDRKVTEASDKASNPELAEALWNLSVEILGEKLGTKGNYGTNGGGVV